MALLLQENVQETALHDPMDLGEKKVADADQ